MAELMAPLHTCPVFSAIGHRQVEAVLATHLPAKIIRLARTDRPSAAKASHVRLPQSELWHCSYGMPITLQFETHDLVRLQIRTNGSATTLVGGKSVPVSQAQGCISSGRVELAFGAEYDQLVWVVSRRVLAAKLAAITGRAAASDLHFDPALDLATPHALTLRRLLDCLVGAVDTTAGEAATIVIGELEQALLASFLATSRHNGQTALDGPAWRVAPWQVRRAEAYIEANWDKTITIDDLVAASGASARSLFRTFRQARDCSPLEFARRLRLEHARAMLADAPAPTSVTDIAFTCGYADAGSFSKAFATRFGESPSRLLNRNTARSRGVTRIDTASRFASRPRPG